MIISVLILMNGVFAMSELALVSAKRMRLERRAEEGSLGARAALRLADDPSHFLSTVQVGITLIGIFNGAFGEASLVSHLAPHLDGLPGIGPYAREVALAIVVLVITVASIIFGELVPKRIAMAYPEVVATLIAQPLRMLSVMMSPFVKLLSLSTNAIVRLIGIHEAKEEAPTEEDIAGIIKEGANTGVFEKTEYDIVSRALRLDDQHLKSLMTPRVDLVILDLADERTANLETIVSQPYSRFPVCRGDRSHILGYVLARDLLAQAVRVGSIDAIDIDGAVQELLYVPETVGAMVLLEMFKKNRAELALIVDEYGDIQGMVTLSDIMSALVGDVAVGGEEHNADAVQRQDGSWLLDGGVSLDRFRDLLETNAAFPGEDSGAYHTLAGFLLYQLGYIPKAADLVDWAGFRFEVMDMDGNRIDRIMVSRQEPPSGSDAEPELD
ncbi:hemolysin family protein [Telluria aromaticivorans]|uniref:hemolysin family protein n=1 Tax=Telluria aromaticivorans TaxID=2725995 RepID=UPI0022772B32|nr:hemolysin family protein [Telluria aromaticivorans]